MTDDRIAAVLQNLTGDSKAQAQGMLRRGLDACELSAVEIARLSGWRDLLPDLSRALASDDREFRVRLLVTLETLGSTADLTKKLITLLAGASADVRASAAIAAAHFPLAPLRTPLVERVRHDPSYPVRFHAAVSLLELADIYPRDIAEHPAIFLALADGEVAMSPPFEDPAKQRAPSVAELAHFATAANQLDAAIADRLSAGHCSQVSPFGTVNLYAFGVNEHALALTVDDRVGSCERALAFVVFLRSPGGFNRAPGGGTSSADPMKTSLTMLPTPLEIGFSRVPQTLTIGNVRVDTTKANVLVVEAGSNGITLLNHSLQDLTFRRHGRPRLEHTDLLRYAPETGPLLRAVFDRTPEVARLIGRPSPPRTEGAPPSTSTVPRPP